MLREHKSKRLFCHSPPTERILLNKQRLLAIAGVVTGALALAGCVALLTLNCDVASPTLTKAGLGVAATLTFFSVVDAVLLSIVKRALPGLIASAYENDPEGAEQSEENKELQQRVKRLWEEGNLDPFIQDIEQYEKDRIKDKNLIGTERFETLLKKHGINEENAPRLIQGARERRQKVQMAHKKFENSMNECLKNSRKRLFNSELEGAVDNYRETGDIVNPNVAGNLKMRKLLNNLFRYQDKRSKSESSE